MTEKSLIESVMTKGPPYIGLQNNKLTTSECEYISENLKTNENLITINLSGNKIGDAGVKLISRALLENKKLAAISLINCGIKDSGAIALANAMAHRVEMTREEIVVWKRRRMELIGASYSNLTIQPTKQKRPPSEASSSAGKESSRKGGKRTDKNDKGAKDKKRKSASSIAATEQKQSSPKIENPIPKDETGIERVDGKMYIPGNKTIHSINLSNNDVSLFNRESF